MQSITTSVELKTAIRQLELQQAEEWPLLKKELLRTAENLKLTNIIKNSFKEAFASPELKTDIINSGIGLSTGILAKKNLQGKTLNPYQKYRAWHWKMFVANKVSKNTSDIKSMGNIILKKSFHREPKLEKQDG